MVKWDLNNLYKIEETDNLIKDLTQKVEDFKKTRDKLDELTPDKIQEILTKKEEIAKLMSRLTAYASLWLTTKTDDSERLEYKNKISEALTDLANDLLFFSLWFKKLPESKAIEFMNKAGKYKYYLFEMRLFKDYTLSENEEKLLNLKDLTGIASIIKLYNIITNAFRFQWEGKEVTKEEVVIHRTSKDREKRKKSYDLVLERYGENENVLGEIYKDIVNNWKNENLKVRKFKSPIQVRNLANDIPDEAVEAMLNVVKKNVHLFQEYFKIKAKVCKLDKFDRYDLYTPAHEEEKEYSYEESKKIVLETYKQFDEKAYEMAKSIFDANQVHSEVQPGKRGGAFCYSIVNEMSPYIMLNHLNKLKDLFTMMHEFGHGIHSVSAKDQTQFTFHSPIPLAETASIFGEMLLAQRMLKECSDDEKIAILIELLDDKYGSIIRQAYFTFFEIEAHDKIAKGATNEDLNKLWMKTLTDQFGDGVSVPEVFKHEWKYIPHIHHTPFYCYGYAFGNLLVLALYKMYEEQGKDFVPKYMKILSTGGSESPTKILNEIGIDITQESFWQQGFDIIKEEVEMLKSLVK